MWIRTVKEWFAVNNEQDALVLLLLGFSFFLPISISVAQPFAYLAIPVWLLAMRKGAERPFRSPFFWPVILFVALILFAALMGPRPEFSVPRSRRMLLLSVIFMMGLVFEHPADDPRRSLLAPLFVFAMGATVLGLWDLVRVPVEVARGMDLFDAGNMRDPQLYLVGACIIVALWIYWPLRLPAPLLSFMVIINITGVILHCKRGVWISFALTALLVAGLTRRYRIVGATVLILVAMLLLPQTRERVLLLHEEIQETTGGRWVLWTKVAPEMIREYPLGTGFRGLRHEDFVRMSPVYLQPGLNHLHNNILQLAVDAGWLGSAVWVGWMVWTLMLMVRMARRYRSNDPLRATVALACLAAFVGLMLNGMVEYNFGNSIIFMVMAFLMGMTSALYRAPPREMDGGLTP